MRTEERRIEWSRTKNGEKTAERTVGSDARLVLPVASERIPKALCCGESLQSPVRDPAVDQLEVKGVTEHEGDLFRLTEVREPVPGEHALAGDDQTVAEGGERGEDGGGGGVDGRLMDRDAMGVEDAQRDGSGVEVDA